MLRTPHRRVASLLLAGALALLLATTAYAATSGTDIHITDQGLEPSTAFAVVDAPVVWHNDTTETVRLSDQPIAPAPGAGSLSLFLPSLSASVGSRATASLTVPTTVHWTSDPITPGQVFTHTYSAPGDYSFFVNTLTGITGTITVLADTPPQVAAEILIAAGSFQMGCDSINDSNCLSNEQPLHTVTLDAYYIDKYEVTTGRYGACVDGGACTPPDNPNSITHIGYFGDAEYADFPVINVTWFQADAFCAWDKKRLPTEAEWEKAARGNSDTRRYPWGNQVPTCDLANVHPFPNPPCFGDTNQVGSYLGGASPYGVMDTAGNVFEWVNDWHDDAYYSTSPAANPQGPASGWARVFRGGSYGNYGPDFAVNARAAYRSGFSPDGTSLELGFRCARTP